MVNCLGEEIECMMKITGDENRKDDMAPYFKSKTIAEKVAWDFIKKG